MTDYLELLLEPWQEDAEEPFVWRKAAVAPSGSGQKTGDERGAGWSAGKEEGREVWPVEAGVQRRGDPAEQLAVLERAVARGKAVQESQRQHLRGVQQGYEAEPRGVRRADSVLTGTRRGLAGVVDAAFERDARRYDGPLGLF